MKSRFLILAAFCALVFGLPTSGLAQRPGGQTELSTVQRLDVDGNHLRACFRKLRRVCAWVADHQVGVDWQTGKSGKRFDDGQTDRDVRNEMAVHHVNVQDARTATFDGTDFFAKTREVGRQNRGGDVDISMVEHAPGPQLLRATGFSSG